MIEYRTEHVPPEACDDVIDILTTFGWVVQSSEEIYNEHNEIIGADIKVYGDGIVDSFMKGWTGKDGSINVRQRKVVTNYVSLVFARDTEMPNYSELKSMNAEFESIMNTPEPKKPVKRTAVTAIGAVLIILSVIFVLLDPENHAELWEIIFSAAFFIIMVPVTIFAWTSYKKKIVYYKDVCGRLQYLYSAAQDLL